MRLGKHESHSTERPFQLVLIFTNSKTEDLRHTAYAVLYLFSFFVSQLYNLNLLSFITSVTTTHSNIYK